MSTNQRPAPEPHLLLRPVIQTSQSNGKDPKSSSPFQLRPSRSIQDGGPRHCLSDITAQSRRTHCNANQPTSPSSHLSGGANGPCQVTGPTAKRPCLRPGGEPQPVTPVKGGTYTTPSAYPHSIMSPSTSGSGPVNPHPAPRTPLPSPRPHPPNTLQTPVVTNHLLQLMTAANNTPKNLPWETPPPKERRFPGPAGLLPQQVIHFHDV